MIEKVRSILLDPRQARGLGFCVSVAHAEYMAAKFREAGIPAEALSAETPRADRDSAQDRLRDREVNFLFVVDLYNEGVDIPEVDTVLFLRPTESLTVFLQQLGRGLRLYEDKECLTVLDFVGQAHRNFRFDLRYRALLTDPSVSLERTGRARLHAPAGRLLDPDGAGRAAARAGEHPPGAAADPIDAGPVTLARAGRGRSAGLRAWRVPGADRDRADDIYRRGCQLVAAARRGRPRAIRSTSPTSHGSRRDCGESPTSPTWS